MVDYTENSDGTITLIVDGVWADYNSDCAFTNRIVVQPFEDGTFRYLANSIEQKELELPVIGKNESLRMLEERNDIYEKAYLVHCADQLFIMWMYKTR